ncbi:hypothetical protein FKP32DRAFT_900771 [Trametes sanguinea]|nr:hypothetical protein FKP32DRAFT_900771 [Trametes sanguinea]
MKSSRTRMSSRRPSTLRISLRIRSYRPSTLRFLLRNGTKDWGQHCLPCFSRHAPNERRRSRANHIQILLYTRSATNACRFPYHGPQCQGPVKTTIRGNRSGGSGGPEEVEQATSRIYCTHGLRQTHVGSPTTVHIRVLSSRLLRGSRSRREAEVRRK